MIFSEQEILKTKVYKAYSPIGNAGCFDKPKVRQSRNRLPFPTANCQFCPLRRKHISRFGCKRNRTGDDVDSHKSCQQPFQWTNATTSTR
jgi:hypothetical protein